jgi:hypothetical protein
MSNTTIKHAPLIDDDIAAVGGIALRWLRYVRELLEESGKKTPKFGRNIAPLPTAL